MRTKIAAGNWKMNLNLEQAQTLVSEVVNMVEDEYKGSAKVVFAPSFPFLASVNYLLKNKTRFALAAQNVHHQTSGAYTGEVSIDMVQSVGAAYCLVGHSERRQYQQESNALLATKLDLCLSRNIHPIYCLGETLEERNAGRLWDVLHSQLRDACFHLDEQQFSKVVIAYEPVWAIGTGVTATSAQAQEVHAYLRQHIEQKYGTFVAQSTSILYGGSVNAKNAAELFSQPDIDGGLVGGASLKSREFTEIVKAL